MPSRGAVLHVAPHPDDEAIGSPATLLKLVAAGWDVHNLVVSLGRPEDRTRRRAEAVEAGRRAGFHTTFVDPPLPISQGDDLQEAEVRLAAVVVDVVDKLAAQVVVSPSPHDVHHGHEVVGRAVRAAMQGRAASWWMWGLWGDLPVPTVLVPFDESCLKRVLDVLDAYHGENERNDYRLLVRARASANVVLGGERVLGFGAAGATGGLPYAELLTQVRWRDGWQAPAGTVSPEPDPAATTAGWTRDLTAWVTSPSAQELLIGRR